MIKRCDKSGTGVLNYADALECFKSQPKDKQAHWKKTLDKIFEGKDKNVPLVPALAFDMELEGKQHRTHNSIGQKTVELCDKNGDGVLNY